MQVLDWSDQNLIDKTDELNSILDLIGEITFGSEPKWITIGIVAGKDTFSDLAQDLELVIIASRLRYGAALELLGHIATYYAKAQIVDRIKDPADDRAVMKLFVIGPKEMSS